VTKKQEYMGIDATKQEMEIKRRNIMEAL